MSSRSAMNSVSGFLQQLQLRRRESNTVPIPPGSDGDQSLVFANALLCQALDSGLDAGIRSGLRSLRTAANEVRMSATHDLAQRLSTLSPIQDELNPEQPASPAAAMDQWAFKSS